MDLEQKEELERMEGFEQFVGYKAINFEQQGFFLQPLQNVEGFAKENQAYMVLIYLD